MLSNIDIFIDYIYFTLFNFYTSRIFFTHIYKRAALIPVVIVVRRSQNLVSLSPFVLTYPFLNKIGCRY
ncbi:hypothetical protein THIOM_000414 [Candidatus Thiomargarita nelsonii]|uniref:Uncharacterized protein n=1 Tax=Candidatus Thiomargarita nelsonii TaxID=1003181 RepID=A0A176S6H7_9GAMM|nr:hypothetical protein THIOM_000414 [Candidatus Thiomargarita nelsonii]